MPLHKFDFECKFCGHVKFCTLSDAQEHTRECVGIDDAAQENYDWTEQGRENHALTMYDNSRGYE